ncbi:MAG TPA: class I SAM-dependent methyltransferase [Bryobacteraceae bacterium]
MALPADFDTVLEGIWEKAREVPGYIGEREFKALAMLAMGAPEGGATVEIGSFKGKSTVALASLAARYGGGRVISIDPHNAPSVTDPMLGPQASSFDDFLHTLRQANVEPYVEVHRATSREVSVGWNRPIRFLWIDGDHTYAGAKLDFDLYSPHLVEGGIIAVHDTLHEFEGPIRIFVEEILGSDRFGPAGFLHTIGWAQYRPNDGARFRAERKRLARRASKLIPLVAGGREVRGLSKYRFKLRCALIPHAVLPAEEWAAKIRRQDSTRIGRDVLV